MTEVAFRHDKRGLKNLERGVDRLKKRLDGFSTVATRFGTVITGALAGAAFPIYNFEVSMNNLQAVLGETREGVEGLREQAKELGRTTQFSAGQAADAQTQLAQAGFSTNEILEATPKVLALAAAGQLEMGEAAALTANQLRAYGLDVSEAGRVTDVMAQAARSSNTTVRELGPAFRQVAPLAKEMGITIEETAGYIALLRDRGFRAEQAGTALRGMFGRLLNPAKEVREVLEGMGIDVDEMIARMQRGEVADVFEDLSERGIDAASAMKIFGQEAGAAALATIGNISQQRDLAVAFRGSAGAAKEMADIQNQGLVGAVRGLISAFEGLMIALGEAGLTKFIETVAERLTELVRWFTTTDEWVRKAIVGVLIMGPVLLALGFAAKALSISLGPIATLLGALLSPIGLVVAGAVALGFAAYWLIRNWDEVGPKIKSAWETTLAWLRGPGTDETVFQWLLSPIPGAFDWITTAWAAVVDVVGAPAAGVFDWTTTAVSGAFDWLETAWTSALALLPSKERIEGTFVAVLAAMTAAVAGIDFAGVGGDIGTAIGDALVLGATALVGFLDLLNVTVAGIDFAAVGGTVGGWFGSALVSAAGGLVGLLEALATAATGIDFSTVGATIGEGIGLRIAAVAGLLTGLLDSMTAAVETIDFGSIGTAIGDVLLGGLVLVAGALGGLLPAMAGAVAAIDFATVGHSIGRFVAAGTRAVFSLLGAMWSTLFRGAAEEGIVGTLKSALGGLGDLLLGLIEGALDLVLGFIDGAFGTSLRDAFWNAFDSAVSFVKDQLPDWSKRLLGIEGGGDAPAAGILEPVTAGIQAEAPAVVEETKGVLGTIRNLLPFSDAREGPLSDLTASGRALVDTFAAGVRSAGEGALQGALLGAFGPGAPLPVGPALPGGVGGAGGALGGGRTVSINIERIEISVDGGGKSPSAAAAETVSELQRQLREMERENDGQVSH